MWRRVLSHVSLGEGCSGSDTKRAEKRSRASLHAGPEDQQGREREFIHNKTRMDYPCQSFAKGSSLTIMWSTRRGVSELDECKYGANDWPPVISLCRLAAITAAKELPPVRVVRRRSNN